MTSALGPLVQWTYWFWRLSSNGGASPDAPYDLEQGRVREH